MIYIVYFCIFLLVLTITKSIFRLIRSSRFLNKEMKLSKIKKKIVVLIPAMNEEKNAKGAVEYFKKLADVCNVLFITTSKEKSMLTYKKLNEEIKKAKATNLKVINCPNTEGTMANQLNYGIKDLDNDDIIAIYNIDSKPERRTFIYAEKEIDDNIVLQQVSYFDDKLKWIIKSAENWQNRWSIVYEMGRYLNNSSIAFKYCIGHGLFIKKKVFDKYGYLSEKDINEDNEFGYRLNINDIMIKPIPFMEQADFAKTVKIYIKQQSTWVNGPLYAFKYYNNNHKSIKNFIRSCLNFKAFISWWLFPILCYSSLVISLFHCYLLSIILLLLIIIYVTGINYLSSRILIKKGYIKTKYHINIISDLLFFMVHTFGSFITIYKLITGKNNIKNKYNTEK